MWKRERKSCLAVLAIQSCLAQPHHNPPPQQSPRNLKPVCHPSGRANGWARPLKGSTPGGRALGLLEDEDADSELRLLLRGRGCCCGGGPRIFSWQIKCFTKENTCKYQGSQNYEKAKAMSVGRLSWHHRQFELEPICIVERPSSCVKSACHFIKHINHGPQKYRTNIKNWPRNKSWQHCFEASQRCRCAQVETVLKQTLPAIATKLHKRPTLSRAKLHKWTRPPPAEKIISQW